MDTDWKEWGVVRRAEIVDVPPFLIEGCDSAKEQIDREENLITEHWNQFRATLMKAGNGASEGRSGGYTELCRLRENLDSRLQKFCERRENLNRQSTITRLTLYAFEQKVQRYDADQKMGEAWMKEEKLIRKDAWRVDARPSHSGEGTSPLKLSQLEISYIPQDDELRGAGVEPNSVSRSHGHWFYGDTTWGGALDKLRRYFLNRSTEWERCCRTVAVLRFRSQILENLLHQYETYGSVEEMTEEKAGEIVQEERYSRSEQMMDWEINAAQLYAYAQEHGQPSTMDEWQNETKVSTRQAWDRLREKDYGIGTGANGLYDALKEWAPEFERKYGRQKANRAAHPFNWPDEHEA